MAYQKVIMLALLVSVLVCYCNSATTKKAAAPAAATAKPAAKPAAAATKAPAAAAPKTTKKSAGCAVTSFVPLIASSILFTIFAKL